MRSLSLALILVSLLLAGSAGCKRRNRSSAQTQAPVSIIGAGDPNVASRFAKGFYGVEGNAWRWTGKEFAVDLSPPLNSDRKGAQLVLKLSVPEPVIQKLTSVQLSAAIQGYKMEPQTYTKPGQSTYTRDVPADKLKNAVVRINFALDRALPPSENDLRELGVIVSEVGLVAK